MELHRALDRLHGTINMLDSQKPVLAPNGNLVEEISFSKMLDLQFYYYRLRVKPFTVNHCDLTVFIGKAPIFLHGRSMGDVDFNVHHTLGGYDVQYIFPPYGTMNAKYPGVNAQQLFAKILQGCDDIFNKWRGY